MLQIFLLCNLISLFKLIQLLKVMINFESTLILECDRRDTEWNVYLCN